MATPVFQKLRIRENDTLLTLNAPADFKQSLNGLPPGIAIVTSAKEYNQVH